VSLYPNQSHVNPITSLAGGGRFGSGGSRSVGKGATSANSARQALWGGRVFLSTFEKQLDAKRRIVAPQEFRATVAPFDGVFCFPSIEADCIEGGGQALFDRYQGLIEELPFGDPLRSALETSVLGGMCKLAFDTAGRITLPESLCDAFGLTDWVAVVGLGDRFQIWSREAFMAHRAEQRLAARQGLAALRQQQRAVRGGAA
jgi:MraZ protein